MPFAITAQSPVFKDHGVAMVLTQWMVWGCDKAYRLGRLAVLQEVRLPCYKEKSGTLFVQSSYAFAGVYIDLALSLEIAVSPLYRLVKRGKAVEAVFISQPFSMKYLPFQPRSK